MGAQHLLRALLVCCAVVLPVKALAFPDNGVLDTFTGADTTSPPNANWTNAELFGSSGLNIRSNAAAPGGTGGRWGAYWNASSFNADSEAYATVTNIGSTAEGFVCTRLGNIGAGTTHAYCVAWADATSEMRIYRVDNEAVTQLGTSITQTITTTDRVGIKTTGDQICSWFSDNGGAWTQLDCQTDATYSAGGRIGLGINGTTTIGAMDDFGGGNVGGISQLWRRRMQ